MGVACLLGRRNHLGERVLGILEEGVVPEFIL